MCVMTLFLFFYLNYHGLIKLLFLKRNLKENMLARCENKRSGKIVLTKNFFAIFIFSLVAKIVAFTSRKREKNVVQKFSDSFNNL